MAHGINANIGHRSLREPSRALTLSQPRAIVPIPDQAALRCLASCMATRKLKGRMSVHTLSI